MGGRKSNGRDRVRLEGEGMIGLRRCNGKAKV